jgi:hypothetical protein
LKYGKGGVEIIRLKSEEPLQLLMKGYLRRTFYDSIGNKT